MLNTGQSSETYSNFEANTGFVRGTRGRLTRCGEAACCGSNTIQNPQICHRKQRQPEAPTLLIPSLRTWSARLENRFHTLSEPASLRTDSVNRGFCISLLTLAIVVLAVSFQILSFLPHPKILIQITRKNLYSMAHNSVLVEV
jgi:hypothetical protein